MIEGTINSCNALFYYLEDMLNIPHNLMNWNDRTNKIKTDGIFIPGFAGLSSPYWKSGFENILIDMPSDPNQIIRAAMESIGFLTNDILTCFKKNGVQLPRKFIISGGGARSTLIQFISNLSGYKIIYTDIKDRTAIGVLRIICPNFNGIQTNHKYELFTPNKDRYTIEKSIKWRRSIKNYNLN